eukprot:Skav225756  [mRNA]  locus=scaffold6265:16324:16593:+ [translate_table: standard]
MFCNRSSDKSQEVQHDVISFNACISACEKGRQWEHALALLEEIASKQLSPTQISCLIQATLFELKKSHAVAHDDTKDVEQFGFCRSREI